jgi:hypothetical protein
MSSLAISGYASHEEIILQVNDDDGSLLFTMNLDGECVYGNGFTVKKVVAILKEIAFSGAKPRAILISDRNARDLISFFGEKILFSQKIDQICRDIFEELIKEEEDWGGYVHD